MIEDFQWFDWARVFSAVVCLLLSLRLTWVARTEWDRWNRKTRNHWWMEWGWITFVGFLGSADALVSNAGGGLRLLFIPMVVVFSIFAILDNDEVRVEKREGLRGKKKRERES